MNMVGSEVFKFRQASVPLRHFIYFTVTKSEGTWSGGRNFQQVCILFNVKMDCVFDIWTP
jgi:hypothetical protein